MGDRRRPVHHFRHTAHGVVEVNRGVRHEPGSAPSGRLRGSLLDATRQLDGGPRFSSAPLPEHTGDMLLSEEGEPYLLDGRYLCTQERRIDAVTGEGEIVIRSQPEKGRGEETKKYVVNVGPGVTLKYPLDSVNMDLRRTNIPGLQWRGGRLIMSTFAEANMDGAVFANDTSAQKAVINSVSFEGASLRDAVFDRVAMKSVSLAGVDGTGARFHVTNMLDVDITDSNIHPNQFTFLPENGFQPDHDPVPHLWYREHTLDEVAAAIGLTHEELTVMVWAGDLEVRDHDQQRVDGRFDAELHHIPQWEIQKLLRAGSQ
jgi:hypothetical protein